MTITHASRDDARRAAAAAVLHWHRRDYPAADALLTDPPTGFTIALVELVHAALVGDGADLELLLPALIRAYSQGNA